MTPGAAPPASENLHLLYNLAQTISSSLDLDKILDQVMDQVIAAIQAERGFVVLTSHRDNGDKLEFRAARGMEHKNIENPEFEVSKGLIEKVLKTGDLILTLNAQDDVRLSNRKSVSDLSLKAILCAPLQTKGSTFGAIYLDNRLQEGVFTQADSELLTAIAGHAAMAIENARLFRDTQSQIETLHLLHDINADLTSTLDLRRVLTTSLERVQDSLGAAACSIMTIEGDDLVFQAAVGEKSEEIKPFHIPKSHGIAGWVVENAEGVIVNNVKEDPRFYSAPDEETGFVTNQLMAAPMIVNEQTLGVIEVFNKPGGFIAADLELLTTIAGTAAIAIENARLYELAVDRGRMEKELQMARRVQTSLIPESAPKIKNWDFASLWVPAREVSGDYYDFIPRDDGKLGLLIADVTDKGMPAALFMAFSRSILRASLDHAASPSQGINDANRLICADSTIGMPVTAVYALLDPNSGQVEYVNAGHNPPLYYQSKQGTLTELSRTGMLLGAVEDTTYEQDAIETHSGDFILFYTDGVPDVINAQNEDFGEQRLHDVVQSNASASAKGLIKSLENAIQDFIGEKAQFDDITLLVAKRK